VSHFAIQESEGLGHVLRLLKGIRHLAFEWTYGAFDFSGCKFDQLEELHVSGLLLRTEKFVEFIDGHRTTLKYITVKNLAVEHFKDLIDGLHKVNGAIDCSLQAVQLEDINDTYGRMEESEKYVLERLDPSKKG
jgi:hypothetical protein